MSEISQASVQCPVSEVEGHEGLPHATAAHELAQSIAQGDGDQVLVTVDTFEGFQSGAEFVPAHASITVSRVDPVAEQQQAEAAETAKERAIQQARDSGRMAGEAEIIEAQRVIKEANQASVPDPAQEDLAPVAELPKRGSG